MSFLILSCSGKVEKSWVVKDFSKGKIFKLKGKDNKIHSTAIVYVEGKVDKSICFRRNENDSNECRKFSKDTSFIKSRYDFYGGTFSYQLMPSETTGKIKVTIKLPYHHKLF